MNCVKLLIAVFVFGDIVICVSGKDNRLETSASAIDKPQPKNNNGIETRYLPYDLGFWLGTAFRPPIRPRPTRAPVTDQPSNSISSDSKCSCSTRITKRQLEEPGDEFRIVGGSPTKPHAFPQMVIIIYNQNQMCGGTILNKEYILTAAHCVKGNSDVSKFRVIVGAYDLDEAEPNRKTLGVKRAVANSAFNTNSFDHDVALLQLETPLVFNKDVKPTCIPTQVNDYTNDEAVATGWGRTKEAGTASRVLREVQVPVISNTQCNRDYRGQFAILDSMICAGYPEGGKDSCSGDSGGPLFINRETSSKLPLQIGITSFGLGCARAGKPGVYSRVDRAIDFISKNVNTDGCKIYTDDA